MFVQGGDIVTNNNFWPLLNVFQDTAFTILWPLTILVYRTFGVQSYLHKGTCLTKINKFDDLDNI
jgi:hypothetical protein